jgi:hypothetical protein
VLAGLRWAGRSSKTIFSTLVSNLSCRVYFRVIKPTDHSGFNFCRSVELWIRISTSFWEPAAVVSLHLTALAPNSATAREGPVGLVWWDHARPRPRAAIRSTYSSNAPRALTNKPLRSSGTSSRSRPARSLDVRTSCPGIVRMVATAARRHRCIDVEW